MRWLEAAYEWRKHHLQENHRSRHASQHELASTYLADGKTKKAVELLEHVVAVRERTLATDHPDRLASLDALSRSPGLLAASPGAGTGQV